MSVPVLVVGAGPVGLFLAVSLLQQGTAVRIVERRSGLRALAASRAVQLHPRSMEALHHIGLLSNVLPYVAAATSSRLVDAQGHLLVDIDYLTASRDTLFPCMFAVPQGILERILYDQLLAMGGFVEWETELVNLTQSDDGVEAQFADGHRSRHEYVVGCDGVHSLVGELIGNDRADHAGSSTSTSSGGGGTLNEVLMADVTLQSPLLPPRAIVTYLMSNIVAKFVPLPQLATTASNAARTGRSATSTTLPPPPPQATQPDTEVGRDANGWRSYRINLHILPAPAAPITRASLAAAAATVASVASSASGLTFPTSRVASSASARSTGSTSSGSAGAPPPSVSDYFAFSGSLGATGAGSAGPSAPAAAAAAAAAPPVYASALPPGHQREMGGPSEANLGNWAGTPAMAQAAARKLSLMAPSDSSASLSSISSVSSGSAMGIDVPALAVAPAGAGGPGAGAGAGSSTVEPWGMEHLATEDRSLDLGLAAAEADDSSDDDHGSELKVRDFLAQFADVAKLGQVRLQDVFWLARYKSGSRLAPRFRDRRIFVAGDAAHTHTTWGGMGMNVGIVDAENLAWKLDLAIKGVAQPAVLDSYEEERREVGQQMVQTAELLMQIIWTPSYPLQAIRNAALAAATGFRCVRDNLTLTLTAARYNYERMSLTLGTAPAGHRLPPIPLVTLPDRIPCSVYDLLYRRPETVVFLYCGREKTAGDKEWMLLEDAAASVRSRYATKLVSICWIAGDQTTAELASAITDGIVFLDVDQGFAALLGDKPGRLILRPDGYVGAALPAQAQDDLLYLSKFLR